MTHARALLLLPLLCACGAEDPFDEALELLPATGTRVGVVVVDDTHHEAVFVSPEGDRIDVERVPIGGERSRTLWAKSTRDSGGVLVMSAPESDKDEDVEERLELLDQEGSVARSWDVHAPFTSVALSPDHRLAVLYFGAPSDSGELHNANQVAIVELGSDALRTLTLNGFGGRVQQIQFPGQRSEGQPTPVDVGGRSRDIIAFLAEGEVVLVDASDPSADQVAVRFGDAAFEPVDAMIRLGNEAFADPVLFVRGTGADVAMLTLVDKPDETTGISGFSAQISLVPVPGGARDFTTYDGAEAPYLLSVGGSALSFTDIRTQQGFSVPLLGSASHLRLRQHETPVGPVTMALAWDDGGDAIHTLELDGVEDTLGRAPQRLLIENGIGDLVILDNDRALVGSGSTLYVVDFVLEQVTPLSASVTYDARSSALHGDLLLLGTPGQPRVSSVDLLTLDPESMVLDAPIERFFYLSDVGRALVVHPDPTGWVTVVDAESPSRKTAVSSWGVLLEDALAR